MAITEKPGRQLTKADGRAVLQANGREVRHVEQVTADNAVLFIGALGRAWTAWVTPADDGGHYIQYEAGWSAEFGSSSTVSKPVHVPNPHIDHTRDSA